MRSKKVRCARLPECCVYVQRTRNGRYIRVGAEAVGACGSADLTPGRARELGKALLEMASEKEKA